MYCRHGQSGQPVYKVWSEMVARCRNVTHKQFRDYGGRGISVCESWLRFDNFIADVGPRPSGSTIERLDNNKGYNPDNCRWATQKEQNNNRRDNVLVEFRGETRTLALWAEKIKFNYHTLYGRIVTRGWDIERAFCQPRRAR